MEVEKIPGEDRTTGKAEMHCAIWFKIYQYIRGDFICN